MNGDGHPDILGTTADGVLNAYVHTGTFVRETGQGARTITEPVLVGHRGGEMMNLIS